MKRRMLTAEVLRSHSFREWGKDMHTSPVSLSTWNIGEMGGKRSFVSLFSHITSIRGWISFSISWSYHWGEKERCWTQHTVDVCHAVHINITTNSTHPLVSKNRYSFKSIGYYWQSELLGLYRPTRATTTFCYIAFPERVFNPFDFCHPFKKIRCDGTCFYP